jgi:hypothetical protein
MDSKNQTKKLAEHFPRDVYDVTLGSSAIFGKGSFGKRFGTRSQDQLGIKDPWRSVLISR